MSSGWHITLLHDAVQSPFRLLKIFSGRSISAMPSSEMHVSSGLSIGTAMAIDKLLTAVPLAVGSTTNSSLN